MGDIAIKVEGVRKRYKLGQIGGGTLTADLQSWWARKRGKEDPNKMIGIDQRLFGQTFYALNGIDLTVKKGEALGIIGKNGAGKSTLLKLLSRVTAPTEGVIDIYGRITSMLEVGTGFHPEMTGRENVYLNGAILGMSRVEIDKKMDQIIDFSEVGEFIDTPVKRYSSGMYVKLAFSVAAHLDSEIMIMDEVLAVGDIAFQQKCLDKMNIAAHHEGKTVLYVSHNMNTIRRLCTRCIVLDAGKIVFDGNVEEAISHYMGVEDTKQVHYDFSGITRNAKKSFRVQLLGMEYVDKSDNVFDRSEIMRFKFFCKANADVQNIKYRLEIYYCDGSIVGSILTNTGLSVKRDTFFDVTCEMSLINLAPGSYYAIALAYEQDSMGHQMDTDRVEPAMFFEVIDRSEQSLNWLHQYWGHIHFQDMKVIDMEKKEHSCNAENHVN